MVKLKLLFTLGWRNIWRQKKRSILVIAASMVGLTGVYFTMGFMNALKKMWVEGAIESSLGHVQIRPAGFAAKRESKNRLTGINIQESLSKLNGKVLGENIEGEVYHALRFDRMGFLRLGSAMQGVSVLGIEPASEKNISQYDEWLIKGDYLVSSNLDPSNNRDGNPKIDCLLGKANAEKFEVEVGDSLVLSIGSDTGNSISTRVYVKGIFQAIAEPMEKSMVLVSREKLSQLFNETPNEYSYAIFRTSHKEYAKQLKKNLSKFLAAYKAKKEIELLTYAELQPSLTRLLELSDTTIYIFYAIMLLGFALILLNSVLMSVFERTREIGIIQAIGSSGSIVFGMIVLESLLLGFLGALGGLAFSGGVILFFNQIGMSLEGFSKGMELMGGTGSVIYPSLYWKDVYTGTMVALSVSMLASLYPALNAIRLQPIHAIYNR